MKTTNYTVNTGFTAGLFTTAGLIAYFLAMRAGGLAQIPELRFFNFVILFAGVAFAMKRHADLTNNSYNYFNTLGSGVLTVVTSVALFSAFVLAWLYLDPDLLAALKANSSAPSWLSPQTAATTVFGEGLASGMVTAYILLSWVSRNRENKAENPAATLKKKQHSELF